MIGKQKTQLAAESNLTSLQIVLYYRSNYIEYFHHEEDFTYGLSNLKYLLYFKIYKENYGGGNWTSLMANNL